MIPHHCNICISIRQQNTFDYGKLTLQCIYNYMNQNGKLRNCIVPLPDLYNQADPIIIRMTTKAANAPMAIWIGSSVLLSA